MSQQPRLNGSGDGRKYIDTIDTDHPDYIREQMRPVDVKQDVRQMAERKRVNEILKSKAFREELEEIVVEQLKSGQNPASLKALQQISELLLPQARLKHGAIFGQGNGPVIPISDIKGDDVAHYDKGEKLLRCKLAAFHRIIDMYNWSQGIPSSYATARLGSDDFLAIPHGLLFKEVTAGRLVKINSRCEPVDHRSTPINKAAASLHSAIYSVRLDIKCVVHIRTPSVVSVSAMNSGLLPICHDAMSLGEISYWEYNSNVPLEGEAIDQLQNELGPVNKVLFMKNDGVIIIGETLEEVFVLTRSVMNAVDTQLRTLPLGLDNIFMPSEEARKRVFQAANQPTSGEKKWKRGEMEFEALMRHLENAGYHTGYLFRDSLTRKVERHDRVNAEVEVPPTAFSYFYEDEGSEKTFPREPKKTTRAEWLNSPNAYKKEETTEAEGTPRHKKITRWVSDNAPGTLIKIETPNQFVPIGDDPKELKEKVRAIRKEYYDENISAGPQSRILEGMTWEEAQKLKDGHVASDTIIMVGAASRGIIQRDHQDAPTLYKTYYAPNPFDNMTEEEVEAYKAEVEKKTRKTKTTGETLMTEDEDEGIVPGPDGRLISTEERLQQVRQIQSESAPSKTPEPELTPPDQNQINQTKSVAVDAMGGGEPRPEVVVVSKPPPSKPERASHAGDTSAALRSPTKSTSSGEGTAPEAEPSGTEQEKSELETASTPTPSSEKEKKKKKRGFRMPSFASKKKDK